MKAVADSLPQINANTNQAINALREDIERWQKGVEKRLDKKINAKFDEVIQALQNIKE